MRPPSLRSASATALALIALGRPAFGLATTAASGQLYERALMSAAGARCGLFTPDIARALEAGREQARGAGLRAGDGAAAVAAVEKRALAKAMSVDCRAPGLRLAAERVRTAFADYARLSVMRFPGSRSAWRAERPDSRLTGPRWAIVQALPGSGGWLLFGVVGGRPVLLDARRDTAAAATSRLRLRDPARFAEPFLSGPPPPSISRVILASGRAAAVQALLPAGATRGVLYTFSPEALAALSALDTRETAQVELVYPTLHGERVFSAPIEVGDFDAAQAFLAAAGLPRL